MAVTPQPHQPHAKVPRRTTARPQRLHIPPALRSKQARQERNLMSARRRVDNSTQKLYEAFLALGDVPAEIPPSVRADIEMAYELAARAAAGLRRKRGRKPSPKPVPRPDQAPGAGAGTAFAG